MGRMARLLKYSNLPLVKLPIGAMRGITIDVLPKWTGDA